MSYVHVKDRLRAYDDFKRVIYMHEFINILGLGLDHNNIKIF